MSEPADVLDVEPARGLRGEIPAPGDKSISHRLAMLCGIARGRSRIENYLRSGDCLHTLEAMRSLGAGTDVHEDVIEIRGTEGRVSDPSGPLDLGNSGTGIRLLTGLLAGFNVHATLTGDASVCSRPMRRIVDPLMRMGARLELKGHDGRAPIVVEGGGLRAIDFTPPVASAQVKSCVLLAGLNAAGRTRVTEPVKTRDHTERLFRAMGLPFEVDGSSVFIEGSAGAPPQIDGGRWRVPGDISSAAFWLVAAAAMENAEVTIRNVGLNPRRTAVLDVLGRMGAHVTLEPCSGGDAWEPTGDVTVRGGALRGAVIEGGEIPNLIDEIPILCVAGALAEGDTVIRDAAELRVKESDRIAVMADGLRRLGVDVEERPDGLTVRGTGQLRASMELQSRGDHRIAMSLAILSLFAPAPCRIHGTACIGTSYPGFRDDLRRLVQ